jgi:hypothetical protein
MVRDWPDPYLPDDDGSPAWRLSPLIPTWRKVHVILAGVEVARNLISDTKNFGVQYLDVVTRAKGTESTVEHVNEFRTLINRVYPAGDFSSFNSNDFANVHHAAWLMLNRALVSLTDLNPHGDWGDPPANTSAHPTPADAVHTEAQTSNVSIEYYHYVPNLTGYYAVSSADVGTPNTGL